MAATALPAFELPGSFYLGRTIGSPEGDPGDEDVLYDARDLTTHAVIVGMTGSGKTGLGISMLEEAALDGVPAIAIDVKGDLANLLLTFPDLKAEDFRPWIDEGAAARTGTTPDALAASTAETWRSGLARWGQDGARIARMRAAVDLALFTPGSTSATPISLLGSLDAPGAALLDDRDGLRDRIAGTVSGLLTLLGLEPDPVRSREHILLSGILDAAWRSGRSLSLADLVRSVQTPPFTSVGVVDLESFFPAGERAQLAMLLNNLLASPGFQAWREGEPLDIDRLLTAPDGRPRLSILYIAHLSDAERMFFVTRLLHEVVAWMRTQPGTGSLRALLYMDEVFGYVPPTANPPSKTPLLTLMKQARAFGLGVVLSTQNPVDLDYKGLSNAGTWMLGRLQTERDKARVLDGLEGASSGAGFERAAMDGILSALGKRRFVLHSVHEAAPILFQTRWALSYLAGPLSTAQVRSLGTPRPAPSPSSSTASAAVTGSDRPVLPPAVPETVLEIRGAFRPGDTVVYRPSLRATGRVRYVKADFGLDSWKTFDLLVPVAAAIEWSLALDATGAEQAGQPIEGASWEPLPAEAARPASYVRWEESVRDHVYRERPLELLRCEALDAVSQPGETETAFRSRLRLLARERRDAEVDRLRDRYASRLQAVQRRVAAAEERVVKEEAQYDQTKLSAALNVGTSLLGALLGRRGRSSLGGASQAARGLGRAAQERTDVRLAGEKLEAARRELAELEAELSSDVAALTASYEPESLVVTTVPVAPRRSDVQVTSVQLAWTPWVRTGDEPARAAWTVG